MVTFLNREALIEAITPVVLGRELPGEDSHSWINRIIDAIGAVAITEDVPNLTVVEIWEQDYLHCSNSHWGDKISWESAKQIAKRLDEVRSVSASKILEGMNEALRHAKGEDVGATEHVFVIDRTDLITRLTERSRGGGLGYWKEGKFIKDREIKELLTEAATVIRGASDQSATAETSDFPEDIDFEEAASYFASRAMGNSKDAELANLKRRWEENEDLDTLVFCLWRHRTGKYRDKSVFKG